MPSLSVIFRPYLHALRDEPKMRAFAAASFVDDIGLAVAAWASMLLMTNLFTTQRARASLMLPALGCFLLGTIVSGPLADWAGRSSLAHLARWRWRLVLWARLAETAMLGVLLLELTAGPPTIGRLLPFVMLTAFTKTAFRPARGAFAVDLLTHESPSVSAAGKRAFDEDGRPLSYKTHLLTLSSLTGTLAAASGLAGLLLGGRILAASQGAYTPLFVIQALAQLGFVAVVFFRCHPDKKAREVGLRDLWSDDVGEDATTAPSAARLRAPVVVARHFGASIRDGVRFLSRREQRPLLALLVGSMIVELVTESYDGKMIIKHVLSGTDESVRLAEIVWSVVGLVGVALVPMLVRAFGSIGRIFLVTMLLDGIVISLAGREAAAQLPSAVTPFVAILVLDHSLTLVSTSLVDFAQNSASSAAMRGRIAGTYAFFVILGDMAVEGLATTVSESIGIPAMLVRVGVAQVVIVVLLAAIGGGRLWRFGMRGSPTSPVGPVGSASGAVS